MAEYNSFWVGNLLRRKLNYDEKNHVREGHKNGQKQSSGDSFFSGFIVRHIKNICSCRSAWTKDGDVIEMCKCSLVSEHSLTLEETKYLQKSNDGYVILRYNSNDSDSSDEEESPFGMIESIIFMNQQPRITFVPYGYCNCPELYKPLMLPVSVSLETTGVVVNTHSYNQEDSILVSKRHIFQPINLSKHQVHIR